MREKLFVNPQINIVTAVPEVWKGLLISELEDLIWFIAEIWMESVFNVTNILHSDRFFAVELSFVKLKNEANLNQFFLPKMSKFAEFFLCWEER